MKITFPEPYQHLHKPIRNINDIIDERRTPGQIASDFVTKLIGSWKFLITQSIFIVIWLLLNVVVLIYHWDPYPFILMNLLLSLQAAYATPIIMMSQNRQEERDRIDAHNDYEINQKVEEEVKIILQNLDSQNNALQNIYDEINELKQIITSPLKPDNEKKN
ncbi:MAG TPA: DUF1003 domain-containing protein [Candidatus Kapabacteria bacterium]|nr:DUF1003 domain-containing protein [Candidatus Kapabacteria bacterium]